MARPVISLLTDFGGRDPSAAICRGVMLGIAPDAVLLDISHEIAKYAIRDGAHVLWCAVPWLPVGTHMAVVDPGVGTERRGIAIRTARGDVLVGPDNGLLLPAAERVGGAVVARELANPAFQLQPVSHSFHARDIFAPAAAHLAAGAPFDQLGPAVPLEHLVRLALPAAEPRPGELRTAVTYLDTFGNAKLAGTTDVLAAALGPLRPGDQLRLELDRRPATTVPWVMTFGDVAAGDALLYEDSYGRLCLAVSQGSAAERFRLELDEPVRIVRR